MTDFLENIRNHSPKIGELAMSQVSNYIEIYVFKEKKEMNF